MIDSIVVAPRDMPGRIALLPRDHVGRPVPWFVATVGGKPDFRIIKPGAVTKALLMKLCWVCGMPFLRQEDRAFLVGPMCAVNRVSAEPPSHLDCAAYSATHCPFLITPGMVRRERHMPADTVMPPGNMIKRNPGVSLVWVTGYKAWGTFRDHDGGTLFSIGLPRRVMWYSRGREATRAEVLDSINSGLPILLEAAEREGPAAVAELETARKRALALLPV